MWTKVLKISNIPKELYLFDDSGMAEWIGDEVLAAKKRKAMSNVNKQIWEQVKIGFSIEDDVIGVRAEKHRGHAQFPVLM